MTKHRNKLVKMKKLNKELSWNDIVGALMTNCLVAVLDIMGFSNLVLQNGKRGSMQCMSALLHTIQGIVSHVDLYAKKQKTTSSFVKNKMIVFWFSDTIIMILPNITSKKDRIAFMTAVKETTLAMFKEGLPVRGCIDYGDCLYNKHCNFLLGLPFINAHRESEKLCFSGLVITDEALKVVNDGHNISGAVVLKVPIKGIGKVVKESRNCIQWCDEDDLLKDEIYRSFSDHDKSVNNRGLELINNTHEVLRMFKHSQNGVN